MAKRTIRLGNDEVLRKKAKPVKEITPNVLELLDDMADTMYNANGVGLAAPQIGILKRVVIIDIGEELIEMINPELIEVKGQQTGEEGCLSFPGRCSIVERPNYAKAKATNRFGQEFIVEGEGLMARAICHEIDHLDGVLYMDNEIRVVQE